MSVKYLRLTDEAAASLSFVRVLYERAFPEDERRPWSSFLRHIVTEKEMHVELIRNDGEDAGVVVWWKVMGWIFIEHLAISETVRGKGMGANVMRHFLQLSNGKIILEVEPPETTNAKRRIQFYERLGFQIHLNPYEQPSYRDSAVSYSMLLMTSASVDDTEKFSDVIAAMKKLVYCR